MHWSSFSLCSIARLQPRKFPLTAQLARSVFSVNLLVQGCWLLPQFLLFAYESSGLRIWLASLSPLFKASQGRKMIRGEPDNAWRDLHSFRRCQVQPLHYKKRKGWILKAPIFSPFFRRDIHIFFRENRAQGPLWLVRACSRSQENPTLWKEFCLLSIIVITVSLSVSRYFKSCYFSSEASWCWCWCSVVGGSCKTLFWVSTNLEWCCSRSIA